MAFNRKDSGVTGVESEISGVNGIETEQKRR